VERSSRETGAHLAGWLLLAAGSLAVVNNYLPGAETLNRGVLNLFGGVVVVTGAVFFVLPWSRWPERANLVVVPLTLALVSLGDLFGGVSAFSYAVFFVVLFMWIGLTQPPGMSLVATPAALVAYVVPGLFAAHPAPGALTSVTVAIPVCVLVGEAIARVTRRLTLREEQYRRLVEMSQQGIWELDAHNYTTYANPRMERMLGYSEGEIVGLDLFRFLDWSDRTRWVAAAGDRGEHEFRLRRKDGSALWATVQTSRVGEPGERFGGTLATVVDATARKAAEEELRRIALVDELTGLHNRRGFLTVAEQLAQLAQRNGKDMALVYIDLDNMKEINDHFGHAAGDRALVETAQILRTTFRKSDVLARLGGDEFCVLVTQDGSAVEKAVTRLTVALALRGRDTFPPLSLSVGLASFDAQAPPSIEALIDRADAAMYAEKARKRATGHG
jgi:diguanylate cyclase (GGDEF)-like protein/PAS domain S-box-containing protein